MDDDSRPAATNTALPFRPATSQRAARCPILENMPLDKNSPCSHTTLLFEPSPFAELAGFERPDRRTRIAATTKSGRAPPAAKIKSENTSLTREAEEEIQTFPGPLVLPHDALNYDPDGDEPAQSFRSWLNEKARNKITPERCTL